MKLYLSSFRLGNYTNELKKLINTSAARVAVSVNAQDYKPEEQRKQKLKQELQDILNLGYEAEELDLRNFFGTNNIVDEMKKYDAVWFSGGNTFLLAKAYRMSGFEEVFTQLVQKNTLVYGGYSAAFCVLAPSLRGVDLVDDKDVQAEGYEQGEIWEGIGLIDFYPLVHYKSNHPESELVDKEHEYVKSNQINYKTFRDGDVYIVDDNRKEKLAGTIGA